MQLVGARGGGRLPGAGIGQGGVEPRGRAAQRSGDLGPSAPGLVQPARTAGSGGVRRIIQQQDHLQIREFLRAADHSVARTTWGSSA